MVDLITGFATAVNETVGVIGSSEANSAVAGIIALIGMFLMLFLVVFLFMMVFTVGLYVYTSFALMSIAKKAKVEPSWLAWIPVGNLFLLSKIAKMHWWPILFFIAFLLPSTNNIFVASIIGIIYLVAFIILFVHGIIWWWKTFETVGKPGWWSLMILIPFFGFIVFLVLMGIAAWGKEEVLSSRVKK